MLRDRIAGLCAGDPDRFASMVSMLRIASSTRIRGGERLVYLDQVWDMYHKTYASIGMGLRNKEELLKYDVWDLTFEDGRPIQFAVLSSTSYGLKSGLSGSDGSAIGKAAQLKRLREGYRQKGVYGEVSHKVKDIALAAGAPVVCAIDAGRVLGKEVQILEDGVQYRRNLSGVGVVVKTMIGYPKGIHVQDSRNPSCPLVRSASKEITEDDHADLGAHLASLLLPED